VYHDVKKQEMGPGGKQASHGRPRTGWQGGEKIKEGGTKTQETLWWLPPEKHREELTITQKKKKTKGRKQKRVLNA